MIKLNRILSAAVAMAMSFTMFAGAVSLDASDDAAAETNDSYDGGTLSFTAYSDDHNKAVFESDNFISTTIREGNHLTITEKNKATDEEIVIEHDINPNESYHDEDISIAPNDMRVQWRSNHYPGDGYITWPNNGAYVLILESDQIYTTTGYSSTLRRYVNTFVSNVQDADDYYQDACEDLVDLIPIVGSAKAIAEVIGALGGVNNNVETWASFLASYVGAGNLSATISAARNAMNAHNCHTTYVDAWYDAEPLCVPW